MKQKCEVYILNKNDELFVVADNVDIFSHFFSVRKYKVFLVFHVS